MKTIFIVSAAITPNIECVFVSVTLRLILYGCKITPVKKRDWRVFEKKCLERFGNRRLAV